MHAKTMDLSLAGDCGAAATKLPKLLDNRSEPAAAKLPKLLDTRSAPRPLQSTLEGETDAWQKRWGGAGWNVFWMPSQGYTLGFAGQRHEKRTQQISAAAALGDSRKRK